MQIDVKLESDPSKVGRETSTRERLYHSAGKSGQGCALGLLFRLTNYSYNVKVSGFYALCGEDVPCTCLQVASTMCIQCECTHLLHSYHNESWYA